MPIAKTKVDSISCEYSDFLVAELVLGVIGSVFRKRVSEGHEASFDSWYKIDSLLSVCAVVQKVTTRTARDSTVKHGTRHTDGHG